MRVTINFGGSVINPDGLDLQTLNIITEVLNKLKEDNHEILTVTGGGKTSRKYIEAAKKLGATHKELDQIGILGTRLNAKLMITALGDIAAPEVPHNFEKANRFMLKNKIPVMGGTKPGHTTDAVAAELADSSNSDLLIFFTDVDGVYTSDPKKNEDAEKIYRMTTSELSKLMSKMEFEPGMKAIIDPLATEILKGTKIRTLVLSSKEIKRLPQIIDGATHNGTEIVPGD